MGKKDKKKKGRGIEKTAAKTEKKLQQKLKKELASLGEEDIELLIAKCQEEGKRQLRVTEDVVDRPSPRASFTFTAHPEKEELILFGGEYFNGVTTTIYNDLYVYCIKKKEWRLIRTPNPPAPRSSHSAVAVAKDGGQLWVFGGEYASPSENQFHHYKDLWVYHLKTRKWEEVPTVGGPSARSGHRMVAVKRNLLVFGGFFDKNSGYIYHNDVYMFSLDNYSWTKIETSGLPPSPRSGCVIGCSTEGKVYVYGGYHREKVNNDDKGVIHEDSYELIPDKCRDGGLKWIRCKLSGCSPTLRCSIGQTLAPNNIVWLFGGVCDDDADEDLTSVFYSDLYKLDLNKGKFFEVSLSGGKELKQKISVEEQLEAMEIESGASAKSIQSPCGRSNSGLAVVRGKLYLYGGSLEIEEKIHTFDDLYCLDTNKLLRWECLQEASESSEAWQEIEESDSSESDEEMDDGE